MKCIASYDPDTGKQLWIVDGPTDQFVASPVFSEKTGLFYVTGGFPDHHIMAIKPDGSGNVTSTHVVWHHHNGAGVSYVPSPIIEGDWFMVTDDRGYAHAFDAKTGVIVWAERFTQIPTGSQQKVQEKCRKGLLGRRAKPARAWPGRRSHSSRAPAPKPAH